MYLHLELGSIFLCVLTEKIIIYLKKYFWRKADKQKKIPEFPVAGLFSQQTGEYLIFINMH